MNTTRDNQVDVIIVGQGIAGSLLAWVLSRAGHSVMVMDDAATSCGSSLAAAGLINPVTGQRLVLAEKWFAYQEQGAALYREIEEVLGVSFYRPMPIVRVVQSEKELVQWDKRLDQEAYRSVVRKLAPHIALPMGLRAPLGAFQIDGGGRVDLEVFIRSVRNWLAGQGRLHRARVKPDEVQVGDSGVTCRGISAKALVFCQGAAGLNNPWFSEQPFNAVKGESMIVSLFGFPADYAVIGKAHIVPLSKELFWVGGTYDREHLDEMPTARGLQQLKNQLQDLTSQRFTVLDHRAAVRPSTVTREPIIEQHAVHAGLFLLNGMGSKGALYGPKLAYDLGRRLASIC